jgi:PPOX class probable F420-dependent enzyme
MATMSDEQRDEFLQERRLGTLAIGRSTKAPLLAPIWYRYTPGGTVDICMSSTSAKAQRLRAEGRASMSVLTEDNPYRYVTVEGPVAVEELGENTYEELLAMSTRYLGKKAGAMYTENFMKNLGSSGSTEAIVRITPENWRTEVLG